MGLQVTERSQLWPRVDSAGGQVLTIDSGDMVSHLWFMPVCWILVDSVPSYGNGLFFHRPSPESCPTSLSGTAALTASLSFTLSLCPGRTHAHTDQVSRRSWSLQLHQPRDPRLRVTGNSAQIRHLGYLRRPRVRLIRRLRCWCQDWVSLSPSVTPLPSV